MPNQDQQVIVSLSREEAETLGVFASAFDSLAEQTDDAKLMEFRPLFGAAIPKLKAALQKGSDE